MTLRFNYTVHDSNKRTTYFAFCYPYSYTECQNMLEKLDTRFSEPSSDKLTDSNKIYYHRELICRSLEGRRVELVTVSSHHGITGEEEPRLDDLFPDKSVNRARRFKEKRVRTHVCTFCYMYAHTHTCINSYFSTYVHVCVCTYIFMC